MTDAILLVSFGGPEGPDEVLPFLQRVTAGRNIPDERLLEVGAHYALFGGRSPINDQCRLLVGAMQAELAARGVDIPVLWGNRNSPPFLADTLADAYAQGIRTIGAVSTAAYSSFSSCRQYRLNLAAALAPLPDDLTVSLARPYALDGPFTAVMARLTGAAWDDLHDPATARLICVTHSIPETMNATSGPQGGGYLAQHEQVMHEIVATLGIPAEQASLAFCSRSGPPQQPWLEPDINDELARFAGEGVTEVVVVPIGFTSDHMEVIYDLDTEATATAAALGMRMSRVPTVGAEPAFVTDLVSRALGQLGAPGQPAASECPADCCPIPAARPAPAQPGRPSAS